MASHIELQALRKADLNWVVKLHSVWTDPICDVPNMYADVREEFSRVLDALEAPGATDSPLGWVIAGKGGSGKTHLLGRFRAECARRHAVFVMVDMTDVHDFWQTVLLGFVMSLLQPVDGKCQIDHLVTSLLSCLHLTVAIDKATAQLKGIGAAALASSLDKLLVRRNFNASSDTFVRCLRPGCEDGFLVRSRARSICNSLLNTMRIPKRDFKNSVSVCECCVAVCVC